MDVKEHIDVDRHANKWMVGKTGRQASRYMDKYIKGMTN
jgi:hypothetical protein